MAAPARVGPARNPKRTAHLCECTGGRFRLYSIIFGFEEPHKELAAAIIVRAVRDARSGRACSVDGLPCGVRDQVGVHVCAQDARQFLASTYAALIIASLRLNRSAVLQAIGEVP